MLCCLGLFAGLAVGSATGGPWTFIAPAAGFGFGLLGDMKLLRGDRKNNGSHGAGCCGVGHMGEEGADSRLKGPVCGKTIEDKTARYRATFKGNAYYLCSFECESSFKDNPERYI
jgi:YHS domain-containing protein